jgi:hypothetical protein
MTVGDRGLVFLCRSTIVDPTDPTRKGPLCHPGRVGAIGVLKCKHYGNERSAIL